MPLLTYEEALGRTLAGVPPTDVAPCAVDEAAGRVLAEDVVARAPLPAEAYSAMDGYAVRLRDLDRETGPPWTLPVVSASRPGRPGPALPSDGPAAARITTGGFLPSGAEAVVLQENVTREGDIITIAQAPARGAHVRPAGADLTAGARALSAGTRLGPGALGLLATLDRTEVAVRQRPVVTFVSTGDELREPGTAGPRGSIPESNTRVLTAIARQAGAVARVAAPLGDEHAATVRGLAAAAQDSHLVVTIGGASVGDRDLVRPALAALGAEIAFWGVALKPGKPTAISRLGGVTVLSVPGNPGSAAVMFNLFGVPLLRALTDRAERAPRRFSLPAEGSHRRRNAAREEYLRAHLVVVDGGLRPRWSANQSSGAVTALAGADALAVVAPGRAEVKPGDPIPVISLRELWW